MAELGRIEIQKGVPPVEVGRSAADFNREMPEGEADGPQIQANTIKQEETIPVQDKQTEEQIAFLEDEIASLEKRQKQTEGEPNDWKAKQELVALQAELEVYQFQQQQQLEGVKACQEKERKRIFRNKKKDPLERLWLWMWEENKEITRDLWRSIKEGHKVWRAQVKADKASGLSGSAGFLKNFGQYFKIAWGENSMQSKERMLKLHANKSMLPPTKQYKAA